MILIYLRGLRIRTTQTFHRIQHMTLLEIANKVLGEDEIGSMPVHGVDAQWFVDQFQELVVLQPQAAQWDEHKIYCAMCHLYLLDPCDLAE